MSDFEFVASFGFLIKNNTRHVCWIFCKTLKYVRLGVLETVSILWALSSTHALTWLSWKNQKNNLLRNWGTSEGVRRLAQGQTSEHVSSRHHVWSPVKVAIADLFHFEAYIEGPPWGPRMSLIKTRTQPFWALVRLLSCFSMGLQYLSCARGDVGIFHPP